MSVSSLHTVNFLTICFSKLQNSTVVKCFLRIREEGDVVLWYEATLPLDFCCDPARIILHFCHL